MTYTLTNFPQVLQSGAPAAATGAGGIMLLRGNAERVTVAIRGTGTLSSGTLVIEEAYFDPDVEGTYAGTWSAIQTVLASAVSGGAQLVVHVQGSVWALRARVSVDIAGGGTIIVTGWAN